MLNHVRFTLESGHVRRTSLCLLWANSGHCALFDHLVGASQYRRWQGETKRLSSLEIDYEFVFLRRLHRKFGRFLALQDAIDVSCCGSKGFFHAGTIGNQATSGDEVTERIDGGQPMLGKKSSNLLSANLQLRTRSCTENLIRRRFRFLASKIPVPAPKFPVPPK
jgi:hypothetical protein